MILPVRLYKQSLNHFTNDERIDTHWVKEDDKVDYESLKEIKESYLGNKVNILI